MKTGLASRWRRAICSSILALSAGLARAAPGDFDPSFGFNGTTTFGYGGSDSANAVAVQPDGKIVVVGNGNANTDVAITRLLPDGSFDDTFDGDGTVGVDVGGADVGRAVALQPDGKIVVGGETNDGVQNDWLILRFNPDGSLDPTFSGDGLDALHLGGDDSILAVAVQPDGKIVLVGTGTTSADVLVVRLLPDGSVDDTFNNLIGSIAIDFGGSDFGNAVALQPDGKIVVAGKSTADPRDAVVVRLTANGSVDATFDGDGKKTIDFGGNDVARGVAVQPDGRIVVTGSGGPNDDITVSRLEADGAFDPTFDLDGTALIDLGGAERGAAMVLQSNGRIVAVGTTAIEGVKFGVTRLDPDGSLDLGFDGVGSVLVDFGGIDEALAMALQPDGGIVVVGKTSVDADVAIVRLQGDPPTGTTSTMPSTTTTLPPASDHPIPLNVVVVKSGRLVKLVAKGTFPLPDPALDDPTVEGGSLSLTGTRGSVSYALGAGSWKALGRRATKGYRFEGAGCAAVLLRPRLLKAVCRGDTGTLALPEPGALDVVLAIGTGTTRYCGTCGGTVRDTERVFRRRGCAAPAVCP